MIVLEICLRIFSPLLGPPIRSWNTMQDAKLLKLQELPRSLMPDIFVFGNSTALVGVNPKYINDSEKEKIIFNAAMNGSDTLSMVRFATEEIWPKYKPRKMLMLLSQGSFRSSLSRDEHPYELASPSEQNALNKSGFFSATYLYKYRNLLRDPMVMNTLVRSIRFRDTNQGVVVRWASDLNAYGYSRFPIANNSVNGGWSTDEDIGKDNLGKVTIPRGTYEDMKMLSRFSEIHKVEIVISTVPTLSLDLEYRSIAQEISSSFGFEFLQGNDVIRNGRFFQDGVYLNSLGAKKFSKWLAKQI
jgi:hypothetical protein